MISTSIAIARCLEVSFHFPRVSWQRFVQLRSVTTEFQFHRGAYLWALCTVLLRFKFEFPNRQFSCLSASNILPFSSRIRNQVILKIYVLILWPNMASSNFYSLHHLFSYQCWNSVIFPMCISWHYRVFFHLVCVSAPPVHRLHYYS